MATTGSVPSIALSQAPATHPYFADLYTFDWQSLSLKVPAVGTIAIALCVVIGVIVGHPSAGLIAGGGAFTIGFGVNQRIADSRLAPHAGRDLRDHHLDCRWDDGRPSWLPDPFGRRYLELRLRSAYSTRRRHCLGRSAGCCHAFRHIRISRRTSCRLPARSAHPRRRSPADSDHFHLSSSYPRAQIEPARTPPHHGAPHRRPALSLALRHPAQHPAPPAPHHRLRFPACHTPQASATRSGSQSLSYCLPKSTAAWEFSPATGSR